MVLVHVLIKIGLCSEHLCTEATFPLNASMLVPSCILHVIPVLHTTSVEHRGMLFTGIVVHSQCLCNAVSQLLTGQHTHKSRIG